MLLAHAQLLMQRGIPIYADVEPTLDTGLIGLSVLAIDERYISVQGLNEGARIEHACKPLDDMTGIRIAGVEVVLRCDDDENDPVLLLMESGLSESEINQSMVLALNTHTADRAGGKLYD